MDSGRRSATGSEDRNGTLDRGLDTKHGCVCYLRMIQLLLLRSYFILIQISFFRKNQRYTPSYLLFPYFKIKERKDYVTIPRAWTCDFLLPFYVISLVDPFKVYLYVVMNPDFHILHCFSYQMSEPREGPVTCMSCEGWS